MATIRDKLGHSLPGTITWPLQRVCEGYGRIGRASLPRIPSPLVTKGAINALFVLQEIPAEELRKGLFPEESWALGVLHPRSLGSSIAPLRAENAPALTAV